MCQVSDKLKLCTCKASEIENLRNYWSFSRYTAEKDLEVFGTILKPFEVPEAIDRYNKTTLLEIVNNPDTFDTDLKPRKRDRLSLHFEVGEEGFMDYGFEFDGEKWVAEDYHEFMWNAEHEEAQYGKIKNGLRKTGY